MWHKGTIAAVLMVVVMGACSNTDEPASTTSAGIGSSPTTVNATRPTPSTTEATLLPATTVSPTSTTTTVAPTPTTTLAGGPAGWDTWTLIYASLPAGSNTRQDAEGIATTIDDGAVLRSDEYPSLHPGYWVVYAGEWHSRFDAGNWCPTDLDPALSCYPRYLGGNVDALLTAASAVMELDTGDLIIYDTKSRTTTRVVTDRFGHWDGSYPGSFALDRVDGNLFFSRGYEDSWYSCDSERGSVEKLDLETGDAVDFADGWSTAISPNGRWLAIVAASECVPDPEYDGWWFAPGDTVEVYDLRSGSTTPRYSFTVPIKPIDYSDPNQVGAVFWDGDTTLLVGMGHGEYRQVELDSRGFLTEAPLEFASSDRVLHAVTDSHYYLTQNLGEAGRIFVTIDRSSGVEIESRQIDQAWFDVAVNGSGDVLVSLDNVLMSPTGTDAVLDGTIYNLTW